MKPLFERQAEDVYSGQCLEVALAAAAGNLKRLDRLLVTPSLVDCEGVDGTTPLYWAIAARSTHLGGIDRLLSAGADPNHYLRDGTGPIHVAAMRGDGAIVRTLLEHGANANLPDKRSNKTPLFYVGTGGYDVVVALLGARADMDHRSLVGHTPMMSLAAARQFRAVNVLLSAGADWRATSKSGDTLSKIVGRMSLTWDEASAEYPYFVQVRKRLREMDPVAASCLSGCIGIHQQEPADFATSDAMITRCTTTVAALATQHARPVVAESDIDAMAASIAREDGRLSRILHVARAYPTTAGWLGHRVEVLQEVRTNAMRILGDDACGSTLDEYLVDELFPDRDARFDRAMETDYAHYARAGIGRQTYLLLRLVEARNRDQRS